MHSPRFRAALLFGVFAVAAFVVAAWVIRPVSTGPVGFDSADSVIHFDRISSGRRLEAFVTTTPKPLLTILYGTAHALIPDWRVISWLSILGLATAVGLVAVLVDRLSGPLGSGYAAVGVLGLPSLLLDVALAYAVVWALLGWLAAGLALTRDRPRYAIAGVAIMLASLARVETLVLVPVIAVGIAIWAVRAQAGGERMPRGVLWLLLSALALPVMILHDWLLTGDPWFWLSVSQVYSAAAGSVSSAADLAHLAVARYSSQPAGILAVIGVAVLIWERRWALAGGVAALSIGIVAFLVLLGLRGTYVSTRYFTAVDVAVAVGAGVGVGRLRLPSLAPIATRLGTSALPGAGLTLALGAFGAFMLSPRFGPIDGPTRVQIRDQRLLTEDADRALPALDDLLASQPGSRSLAAGSGTPSGRGSTPTQASLLVPALLRPRLSVDLHVPLTNVAGLSPAVVDPGQHALRPGQVVFHDRLGDLPTSAYASLEATSEQRLGDVTLQPIAWDRVRGWWVLVTR